MSVPTRTPQFVTPPAYPKTIDNRPSLPRIGYRIGTYADVRAALLWNLDRLATLSAWTHRDADDPGIALLEGGAILADILTFYQELYANEAFLRTATWRDSVSDLVKLLGYRVSPGVGGNATFAFDVRGADPVTVPAGFPVKANLAPNPSASDFETVGPAPATAYPWLGSFNLFALQQVVPFGQATSQLVVTAGGEGLSFAPGERLLVGIVERYGVGPGGGDAVVVTVGSVRQVHGQNVLTLKQPLPAFDSSTTALTAYRLGRTFRHFGYNAPAQEITLNNAVTDEHGKVTTPAIPQAAELLYSRSLIDTTYSDDGAQVDPSLDSTVFPLDSAVDNLVTQAAIVVQFLAGDAALYNVTVVRTIASLRSGSMVWGQQRGAVTFVTLDSQVGFYEADIRQTRLTETTSPALTVMALPTTNAGIDDQLSYEGTQAQAQALLRQRIYLPTQKGADPEIAVVLAVDAAGQDPLSNPNLFPLRIRTAKGIDTSLYPYEAPAGGPPLVDVLGNLVDATQGKTEKTAVLGNGDAAQTFQTFKLPKAPLTYLLSDGAAPPGVPQLTVRVAGVEWHYVDSLYGEGAGDHVYVVRQDQTGASYVQFGDGITGARLPSGVGNVTAVFRTGNGAFGPMKKGATPSAGGRLDPLKALALAGDATGGAGAEGADQARAAAPGRVQSMGRLVSLQDFQTEARAIPGVGLVAVRWDLDASGAPSVLVTMLMTTGGVKEFATAQQTLLDASRCRGADRFPVVVSEGFYSYVALVVNVSIDPDLDWDTLSAAIKEALGIAGEESAGVDGSHGLFAYEQREFGESEYASRVEATIQNVGGVVWCEVQGQGVIGDSQTVLDPTTLVMPYNLGLAGTLSCAPDHVLRLYSVPGSSNPLQLVQAPAPPHIECSGD